MLLRTQADMPRSRGNPSNNKGCFRLINDSSDSHTFLGLTTSEKTQIYRSSHLNVEKM